MRSVYADRAGRCDALLASGFNAENRSFQRPVATRNSAAEVSRVALTGVCSGADAPQLRT